uniref:RNase H type-1 domain-containing protein n=1 Tax=Fagus sylvatica TaxID=28930 RepID=A0A2N9EPE0_FAGSY
MGKTTLPILAGPISLQTEFIVVRGTSPYNAIVGRDWLHRMKAVPSTLHQKLRFPTEEGVMEINGDQVTAKQCVLAAVAQKSPEDEHPYQGFMTITGTCCRTNLSVDDRQGLVTLLMGFRDVFAWSVYEAPGVSPDLACHSLNISGDAKPVSQKRRKLGTRTGRDSCKGSREVTGGQCHSNAGATYQRMVTGMFGHLIGNTVEAYIDDMLIKSKKKTSHVEDLREVLEILRATKLRLNATKCLFGVSSGKFLGHMISYNGVEANPDQISALLSLQPPKDAKQVQRLTGMVAALGRFISRSADSSDFSGRITRWGVHLGSLGVEYKPRTSIKGQVLADFVAEFQGKEASTESNYTPSPCVIGDSSEWKLFVDGASNMKGAGAGAVLVSPEGLILEQAVFCDSQLVVNHISGEYSARDERMMTYLSITKSLLSKFESVQVEQVRREYNSHADILAKLATALESDLHRSVTVEVLSAPSTLIDTVDRVCGTNMEPSWMDPLIAYLRDNCLPQDPKAANVIKRKAPRYWLSKEGNLYKRSFSGPYLLCVHPSLVDDLLYEIHEGICGSHTGGRSLAHRAMSQGYWWPFMQSDAVRYVRKCDKCQRFAPKIHQPARELNPLSSPWPFAQWGLDIVGPLPRAPGKQEVFDRGNGLFHQVGGGRTTFSHSGKWILSGFYGRASLRDLEFLLLTRDIPSLNGQAEVSNKVILDGIKKRLEEAKGRWVEELPSVMWTHRTTKRRSTGETPFALAYGVEAVIPLEVGLPTTRTTEFDIDENESSLRMDLNLVEERRDMATIRLASYQHQMKRGYDKNIRPRSFQVGDLVLRKVVANTRNPNDGKLGPNWEGPYQVTSFAGVGAYRLTDLDGKSVLRPWNICNLKKYFY